MRLSGIGFGLVVRRVNLVGVIVLLHRWTRLFLAFYLRLERKGSIFFASSSSSHGVAKYLFG